MKEIVDLQNSQREQSENLDQEERWEEILKSKRFKYFIFTCPFSRAAK
ncbi:hypothetical protein [Wolbachia endosymbiont (group A) of Limnophora tigrina]